MGEPIRASAFIVEDEYGKERARLSSHPDTGDPTLVFSDAQGKRRLALAVSDAATILIIDAAGVSRLVITETENEEQSGLSVSMKNSSGETVLTFGTSGDAFTFLKLSPDAAEALATEMAKHDTQKKQKVSFWRR